MRISDWSSDVCSSDLLSQHRPLAAREEFRGRDRDGARQFGRGPRGRGAAGCRLSRDRRGMRERQVKRFAWATVIAAVAAASGPAAAEETPGFKETPLLAGRTEGPTDEIQSPMRNS